MERKKILYCFAGNSIFGYRDIDMFRLHYQVKVSHYNLPDNNFKKVLSYIKYNLSVLRHIWRSDCVIVNFGAWHTIGPIFLAKILKIKSIVILGGFDVGNIPSLNYGVFHKPSALQWWMRRVYGFATYLCPISNALIQSKNKYADPKGFGYDIGLLAHLPKVKDKIRLIPRDFDFDFWLEDNKAVRKGILAIAYIYYEQTFYVKGFDIMVECARIMPNFEFTFAGFSTQMMEKYHSIMPQNVRLLSIQSKEEALKLYQSHKVFLMPSMTEGLGQTLCEAMLCGCTPVVSHVGILPEIVGDHGFVLNIKDINLLKSLIEKSLSLELDTQKVRQSILEKYPKGQRIEQFNNLIN